MSVTDKQILGSNLCNIECTEKNNIIHPETCVNQVLIGNGSTVNLPAWFDGDTDPEVHHGSFGDYSNMLAWLEANYPNSYTLPSATASRLGGIKVGNYLTIDNGVLSVNISELNIPTIDSSANTATFNKYGVIRLGNDTPLPNMLANDTIIDGDITEYPVRFDINSRAGIAIPNSLFTQVQTDWNQNNTSAADFIKNKPGIFSVSNNGLVPYPTEASNSKFLSARGTWETIHTYTAGTNITIAGDTISAIDTTYNVFEGTDGINDGTTGLVPAPTTSDVDKYLSSDGSWKSVIDTNLKNHEVISIAKTITDEYGDSFSLYNVKCHLSDEIVKVCNKQDFITTDTSYTYSLNLTGSVQWSKNITDTNKAAGVLYIHKTACKGLLKITISQENNSVNGNVISDYILGFVADTPPDPIFGIYTNLDWPLVLRQETSGSTGYLYCYLKIPDEFVGTITITGIGGAQHHEGSSQRDPQVHSFYYAADSQQITSYDLLDTLSTSYATCCDITGDTYIGSNYDSVNNVGIPDAFVLQESMSIGTTLYDNEVNDAVIHSLVSRVKRLETLVYNIINQNNNF